VEFRGQLYFAVNFEDGRRALFRSNGTEAGTVEVKAFAPQPPTYLERLGGLTPAADRLFFLASEAATGNELWVSDGTPGDTRLVADLTPGPEGSWLSHLAALGHTLVFFREVPESPTTPGHTELWRSDGSAAGTQRLLDFGPSATVSWQDLRLGQAFLFFVSGPGRGTELWKTDGTVAGTSRLRRVDAGQVSVFDVRTVGNTGFFTLIDEDSSTEVWRTDGTPGGTLRMHTFGPRPFFARLLGPQGAFLYLTLVDPETQRLNLYRLPLDDSGGRQYVVSLPNPYADEPDAIPSPNDVSITGGRIFFTLSISSPGPAPRDTQLWVTDGTRAGTRLLRRPLSLSDEYSSPLHAVSERLVFFSADEPMTAGIEPWVTNGTTEGTRRLRDIAPGLVNSYPRSFTRVGDRVFFSAYDETRAGQLWMVPLTRACLAEER
jgi:ELWxxDGT repeat protein